MRRIGACLEVGLALLAVLGLDVWLLSLLVSVRWIHDGWTVFVPIAALGLPIWRRKWLVALLGLFLVPPAAVPEVISRCVLYSLEWAAHAVAGHAGAITPAPTFKRRTLH